MKPKGNTWRELCARAIEGNGGYSSGYHDRYALSWNVSIDWGVPDSDSPLIQTQAFEQLHENRGVTREQFDAVVTQEKWDKWAEERDNEHNQNSIWEIARESMVWGVTDCDTYKSVRPEIAARYGLPGSEPKLHSGKRYDREHKYRAGAWSHTLSFDVKWEFAGRGGKHLCLTAFESRILTVRNESLVEALRTPEEGNGYSNEWCQKLVAFIHECDLMFDSKMVKQEFEYQVCYHAASELHDLYEECVAEAAEAKERQHWAERDVMTEGT